MDHSVRLLVALVNGHLDNDMSRFRLSQDKTELLRNVSGSQTFAQELSGRMLVVLLCSWHQYAVKPPSSGKAAPVTHSDSSDAR